MKKQLRKALSCLPVLALAAPQTVAQITGPSSSQSPYLKSSVSGGQFTSILTATDVVNGYKMCGTPDGLGAWDNGDGTFTLLVNHEFGNTAGVARAHGSIGAFVSKWIINKTTLTVLSGQDLIQRIYLWNPVTSSYILYNSAFPSTNAALGRFCSADLAAPTAYYNPLTGKGTQERIFMNGEETGTEGRAMGHIASGANAGSTYELPRLGKFSWENSVASPRISDTTIVAGMDDATPGQVYFYIGTKTAAGTEMDRAGLTNGRLYGIAVNGLLTETNAAAPTANTPFTLADLGNVQNMTGAQLQTASNNAGVTQFLRPEDGAWDPYTPGDFYFATTNAFNSNSRLWRVRFTNPGNPLLGGTITAVLEGGEGQQMFDNITIDNSGHVLLVEDVGNNAHIGKMWQYTMATDQLVPVAYHDSARFLSGGAAYLTQDEEASGVLDVQQILGPGMFLIDVQAHYGISGEVVEGGQLLRFYNPETFNNNPEISITGNSQAINDGATTTIAANNTNFGGINTGSTITKTFVVKNSGPGALKVLGYSLSGANAAAFSIQNGPAFPLTIAANDSAVITVQFAPTTTGAHNAVLNVMTNDLDETTYDFAISANGTTPDIAVSGNNVTITNGDLTPGAANNTDFGQVNLGSTADKTFVVRNSGTGPLTITGLTFTGPSPADFALTGAPAFPLTIAAGATQSITIRFTPSAAGVRSATLNVASDDLDAGTYTFAIQGNGRDATSVGSLSSATFVRLFPNPTGDEATLAVMLQKADALTVTVYDIQGREVMAFPAKTYGTGEQRITVSTAGLQNATYTVELRSGAESVRIRMVVKH